MEPQDEDIKKALECCVNGQCEDCPFYTRCFKHESVATIALDLINRQQAEIDRLNSLCESLGNDVDLKLKYIYELEAKLEAFKSEAIKEFAERLRKEVANTWFGVCCTGETEEYKEGCLFGLVEKQKHCLCIINNLLAEMVGGENGKSN